MNAAENPVIAIPALGSLIEGGFFHGVLLVDGNLYGEVTGPAADCFVKDLPWLKTPKDVPGATSESDGLANTRAMAEAGSPLGQAALACRSGGHCDWYVPARVGALLQHGNLKPLLPAAEAFDTTLWHQTSTQYSRGNAWYQDFNNGDTDISSKDWSGGAARVVRRFLLQSLSA